MEEKRETSVWHVAVVALAIFVGGTIAVNLFSGNDVVAIAAQK